MTDEEGRRQTHQVPMFKRYNVVHGPIAERYLTQVRDIVKTKLLPWVRTTRHWRALVKDKVRMLPEKVGDFEIAYGVTEGGVVEVTVRSRTDKVERCLIRMNGYRNAGDGRDDLTVVLSIDGALLSGWWNAAGDTPKLDSQVSEETYQRGGEEDLTS